MKVPHFSHLPGSDCATGAETALHLAAKQLVSDKRWIRLPALEVRVTRNDPQCGLFDVRKVFGTDETWYFDRVALEMAVGKVRPDVIGFIGDASNGVEIRVTHEVDTDKQAYLASTGLPCIEVVLTTFVGKVFTFDALESAVLASVDNKRWLFHPRLAEWEALLLAGFEDWRQARLADLARSQEQPARSAAPPLRPTDVSRAANEEYRALSVAEKWARLERQLGVRRNKFPSHLRVALREGAGAVLADKDLWQGAVFAEFVIENRERRVPNEGALSAWLAQRFGVKGGEAAARPAARSYLNYLRACGFLRRQGFDLYVAHDQLTAPLKERPAPPASPRGNEASTAVPAPGIQWRDIWPDGERLRLWADEMSKSGGGFDAHWFVDWLLGRDAPPSVDEVHSAFAGAKGNPGEVMTVLRGLGVVTNTWRYFSHGEPAPWADV